ncbi:UNVERIFIED_CONTAM: hypothetical protein NCL1_43670 [Trichonephila clavipes]
MTRSVAKSSCVVEQCYVNIHSLAVGLTHLAMLFSIRRAINLPFPPSGFRRCCRCNQYFNPELLPRVLFRADLNFCERCRISS